MDYVIPCGGSKVHPEGVCRQKLHRNISAGLNRLHQRHTQEEFDEQLEQQRQSLNEQRRNLDLQEKMLGVGAGTHRVIKENRTKTKPRVTPIVPGAPKPSNKNKQ